MWLMAMDTYPDVVKKMCFLIPLLLLGMSLLIITLLDFVMIIGRLSCSFRQKFCQIKAGVDPGLPIGGTPTLGEVATYDFAKFPPKLHEIENILGRWGRPQIRQ